MSVEPARNVRLGGHSLEEECAAYESLGRLVETAACFDMQITALLGAMTGIGEIGTHEMILHSIDFNRKCEIIKAMLGRFPDREPWSKVKPILKFGRTLIEKRNLAAHGVIGTHEGQIIFFTVALPKVLHEDNERALLRANEIPPLVERASDRLDEIVGLVEQFESFVPALNSRHRVQRAWERMVKLAEKEA